MNKVVFDFDPFELTGVEPPKDRDQREAALEEVAEYVKTQALSYVADGKSPVAGGAWTRSLSKDYKKKKEAEGGQGFANLELTGDMLDALDCYPKSGTKLRFGIEGEEAPKADGHNNHSGDSTLPPREFIPKEGGSFRREILSGIRDIIKEFSDD